MASFANGVFAFLAGIRDMILGCLYASQIVFQNSKIRNKVALSFILNGLILALSVVIFERGVLPLILFLTSWLAHLFSRDLSPDQLVWLESLISYTFTGLWMLPMFVICTPINSLWFREIAIEANSHIKTHRQGNSRKSTRWELKKLITDLLYGIAVEVVFAIQASLISLLPIGGWVLALIQMALLYSLYSFEYKWFYEGITVQKRLSLIETQWPYFLGFGLILSFLTSTPLLSPFASGGSGIRHTVGNIVLSACVFALAFPLMILASFRIPPFQASFYQIPVFKVARLTCNKLFNLLLSPPS